jgi:hypothetical protein
MFHIAVHRVQAKDGRNIRGQNKEVDPVEEDYTWRGMDDHQPEFVWPPQTKINIDELVHDAFQRTDEIHREVCGDRGIP